MAKEVIRIERVANLTSMELNDSNAVEADDIRMEISELGLILPVPENRPGATATVLLSLCLTNNTSNPFCFNPDGTLIPELVALDGQAQQRQVATEQQEGEIQTNTSSPLGLRVRLTRFISNLARQPKRSEMREMNYWLVEPRWFRNFFLTAKLSWKGNWLQLRVPTIPDDFQDLTSHKDFWFFDALQPQTYQLRFIYDSDRGTRPSSDPDTREVGNVQEMVSRQLATPFVSLRLVQPTEPDSSAIEVDGVRFKLEMPETLLTTKNLWPGAKKIVKLGIRATNNRSTFLYFERLNSLYPTLIGPDGKVVEPYSDLMRLRVGKGPLYYSAKPGESALFVLDGTLSRKVFKLQLAIPNEAGGFWYFDNLKPGAYQLRFIYLVEQSMLTPQPEEQTLTAVWTGQIALPFVEFHIAQ